MQIARASKVGVTHQNADLLCPYLTSCAARLLLPLLKAIAETESSHDAGIIALAPYIAIRRLFTSEGMRFINVRSVATRRSVQEFRNLSKVKATLKPRLEGPQTNNGLAARAALDEEDMGYDTFDSAHSSLDPPPVFTTNYFEAQIAGAT